jgi:LysR family glycine cleavage system transcriptional activator
MLPARFYPPLSALRAADSAARLGSFSAAAAELNITQSAVSQAVRQLEAQLGIRIFERIPGGIKATEQGLRYIDNIRPALEMIAEAGSSLAGQTAQMMVLGCVRSLLHNWLLPRLPSFEAVQTGYDLNVVGLGRDPSEARSCDLAIVISELQHAPANWELIARETLVPVATPASADRLGAALDEAGGPLSIPCIGSGWDSWSRAAGLPRVIVPSGIRFRDASASLEAARGGLGIALVSELVCRDDLATGALVKLSTVEGDRDRGYWLVAKDANAPVAIALRDWLRAECQKGIADQ